MKCQKWEVLEGIILISKAFNLVQIHFQAQQSEDFYSILILVIILGDALSPSGTMYYDNL